jgi:hypothetical protein
LQGLQQARLAVIISATSLLAVWGGIGGFVAVHAVDEAPHRAAEADLRAAFQAVVHYSKHHDTFPDTLEQVVSSETAGRYVYLGKGLSSAYNNYRTTGSQGIVVMYATHSVDGVVAAICANGMTHEWTKPILEGALRDSEKQRRFRGIDGHHPEQ